MEAFGQRAPVLGEGMGHSGAEACALALASPEP